MRPVHTTGSIPPASASSEGARPAFAAARAICRRRFPEFYYVCAFLPRHKRDAAHTVVAFCRMIEEAIVAPPGQFVGARVKREHPVFSLDQLEPTGRDGRDGDSCGHVDSLDTRLRLLRERVEEIYEDRVELPAVEARSEQQHALAAFAQTVRRFEIPRRWLLEFVEGCRAGLTARRYRSWDELHVHCSRVSGTVAMMMSCVLGATHSDAPRFAESAGTAIRLVTILRDVKKDRQRDRVFLPQDELRRFGYTEHDLMLGRLSEKFRSLMRFEVARARQLCQHGMDGLRWLAGDGSRLTAAAICLNQLAILDRIERSGYDVFRPREMPPGMGDRMRLIARAWQEARLRAR
jgi:phytoene/squalene synthetase